MCRNRFCNMDIYEECVRHDCDSCCNPHTYFPQNCCCPPYMPYPQFCRPPECGFEYKYWCGGKRICVRSNPCGCSLNVELKKPHRI